MTDAAVVLPLFSKVFYHKIIKIDSEKILRFARNIVFGESGQDSIEKAAGSIGAKASKDRAVLERPEFKELRDQVLCEFDLFKQSVLKTPTEFSLTTSWLTKTAPGACSHLHNHSNCMYSGVLYIKAEKNCGKIHFEDHSTRTFLLDDPVEYNLFNSLSWSFEPQEGFLIFFPSEVKHAIKTNNSNSDRYSLAFNFMPSGVFGSGDSLLKIDVHSGA